MINRNSVDYKERITNLCKYILSKDYGTTLTFEELNEFIGEDLNEEYGKKRFANAIRNARKKIYKNGYVLKGVMNIGYYILKPNQISSYTYRNFILKPFNSLYTAQIILESTEKNKLNSKEKQRHIKTEKLNFELISAKDLLFNDDEYKELKEE